MAEQGSTQNVKLSDPVTICLHGARLKLRQARLLAEEQQNNPPEGRARITAALDAVQDALDIWEPTA